MLRKARRVMSVVLHNHANISTFDERSGEESKLWRKFQLVGADFLHLGLQFDQRLAVTMANARLRLRRSRYDTPNE